MKAAADVLTGGSAVGAGGSSAMEMSCACWGSSGTSDEAAPEAVVRVSDVKADLTGNSTGTRLVMDRV